MWSIRCRRRERKQRLEQRRTVGQACALLVDDFDPFTFEHGHIRIFPEAIKTAMLNDQESRFDILDHEAEAGNFSRCAPNSQLVTVIPNTEMYLRTLYCRRELRQNTGG